MSDTEEVQGQEKTAKTIGSSASAKDDKHESYERILELKRNKR
jgi:hypothetical protein